MLTSPAQATFPPTKLFHKTLDKCMDNPSNNFYITLWKSTTAIWETQKIGYPHSYYLVFSKFFTNLDRKKI